ncbi:unnamed protein product [Danaus chrysippus]|uniref:(African queen) hypothetical protein n=1 Tax=Danaus chrysippus TaxID=151541 RepID=A0A8J2VU02_9NEOP|nr:unnamed protein product [Danaus chrysippus]
MPAATQTHEAVPTTSVEATNSVPAVLSTTLQETVPSASADVENIDDVLQVLSPLPDASKKRLIARKRKTQKSEILTSSPYKKGLMEKIKDPKAVEKVKKNMQVKAKKVVSKPENKETECIICGHGKGAADGVGGALKRQADFCSKRHRYEDIDNVASTIPSNILPLKGTMQIHQMFSETRGILNYRVLSCFCEKFCSCHVPKTYSPLPETESNIDKILDHLFPNEKDDVVIQEMEDLSLTAKSNVDEEGDVLVMFLKTVDDSGRLFKLVENDISDVPYEDLIKILPNPKVVKKRRRQFLKFDEPLPVFEK